LQSGLVKTTNNFCNGSGKAHVLHSLIAGCGLILSAIPLFAMDLDLWFQ
jgi:hypothetical protein